MSTICIISDECPAAGPGQGSTQGTPLVKAKRTDVKPQIYLDFYPAAKTVSINQAESNCAVV